MTVSQGEFSGEVTVPAIDALPGTLDLQLSTL